MNVIYRTCTINTQYIHYVEANGLVAFEQNNSEESTKSGEPSLVEAAEAQPLPEVVNGESYVRIDDDIPCFNENDNIEDDIVEAISSKRPRQEDGGEGEDGDPDDEAVVNYPHGCQTLRTASTTVLR